MTTGSEPLKCSALSKRYGDIKALKDVSLHIAAGVTAILGENGAGKTTLIKCALGLERPSAGEIALFGQSPLKRASRRQVGVMLQDTELPDLLTGRELIALFASYYSQPLDLDTLIADTRIGDFVDRRYKKLSGGQKRRIQFALAIVGDPALVFLDEPTTGLDSEARKALWDTVRAFAAAGRAIVLTTHYLEEADALADRIIIMKSGEVIANNDAESIRAGVGGSVIRCATQVPMAEVRKLPACTGAAMAGRIMEIRSTDAAQTLRSLLSLDEAVAELTVSKPRLEDIFEELNQ